MGKLAYFSLKKFRFAFREREFRPLGDARRGGNQQIEGGSEVIEGLGNKDGHHLRDRPDDELDRFCSSIRIRLTNDSVTVSEVPEDFFEIVDVLAGPFNL